MVLLILLGVGVIIIWVSKDEEVGKSINIGCDLVGELFVELWVLLMVVVIMLLFVVIFGMFSMVFIIFVLVLFVVGMVGIFKLLVDV